jgi:hypothetical protein
VENIVKNLKNQVRHQEICLLSFILAFAMLKFPLQHHIILARYQHYGICLYIWSLGFFLQTVWSWRKLTPKGRLCLLATGSYVGTFALIFYQSPWLDSRMAIQTDEQEAFRLVYTLICVLFGFLVSVTWLAWLVERKSPVKEDQ